MHADFMRIDDKVAIKIHVPIHFLNEEASIGVKTEGGIVQHQNTDIEILCLPADIPEYIEVDMAEVALALGEDHDLAIASIIAPKGVSEEEEEAAAAAAAEAAEAGAEEGSEEEGGSEE
jgi:large subunit ribosomal protein L25